MTTQVQARDAMQFINEQDAATLERFIERLELRGKDPTFVGHRESYLDVNEPAAHRGDPGPRLRHRRRGTAPASQIATSQKSRCTSNPIALPSDPLTTTSSPRWTGRTSGRTTTTDTCSRHNPGKPQGRPRETSPRSKRIVQSGLPGCVLPESPCPGSPDRTVRAGQQPSEDHFHAPTSRRLVRKMPRCRFAWRKRARAARRATRSEFVQRGSASVSRPRRCVCVGAVADHGADRPPRPGASARAAPSREGLA
jgi:hypothetical protein